MALICTGRLESTNQQQVGKKRRVGLGRTFDKFQLNALLEKGRLRVPYCTTGIAAGFEKAHLSCGTQTLSLCKQLDTFGGFLID